MGGDIEGPMIDTAARVSYAPAKTKQLLIATSNSHLLRLDARSGRLLNKVLYNPFYLFFTSYMGSTSSRP